MKKKLFVLGFFILLTMNFFAQKLPGSYYDFMEEMESKEVTHNPSRLIIYRPENKYSLNEIPCYIKLENAEGKDVTNEKSFCKTFYEWVSWRSDVSKIRGHDPKSFSTLFDRNNLEKVYQYKNKIYLMGGMASHLNLAKGKYKITVYTPIKDQFNFKYPTNTKAFEWKSNEFFYDTENPTKVIFVSPKFTDNGFYAGDWIIDYKAPKYF
jgi:hypothetical protein